MATKLPPRSSPEERQWFVRQMLNDTGFMCRNVLGMDTDRDPTGEPVSAEGEGGVRADGPHGETVAFMDDESVQYKVLWTPRFTYKSSKVTGFIVRNILKYPDIAILLAMSTTDRAAERVRVIRDILTSNPIILELFGELRGPSWTEGSFITAMRQDQTLLTPTLYSASPQKGTAGGRPDLIVFDDIVDETNSVTDVQLARGRKFVESTLALRGQRTRYMTIATPWHEADANHWCIDAGWKKCVHLDIGCEVNVDEKGSVLLSGDSRWPHMPVEFLRRYLRDASGTGGGGMSYEFFMSQFKLQVVRGLRAHFTRTQFQPATWQEKVHKDLTGYLLTDTAPSGSTKGDLNVLFYVGVDERNHVYMLDLEVGFWQMYEFCDKFLNMLQRWASKVNHRHELWEKGHNHLSYLQHISVQAEARKIRISPVAETRNQSIAGKDIRIMATSVRFQAGEVFVMDTMPKTWNAGTETRELWNPYGEQDVQTKVRLPSGDLVQQFIRFPTHARKDIPDAFALVNTLDSETKRMVCIHVKSSRQRVAESIERKPIQFSGSRSHGSTARFYQRIRARRGGSDGVRDLG